MSFWAYMLRCADDSFYVGHSDDLEARIAQHECKEVPCYTSSRLPTCLVWSQEFATREEALSAERQIKGWRRSKKEALIRSDWGAIRQLAWGTRNELPEHLR